MKTLIRSLALAALLVFAGNATAALRVVTTIPDLADFTREIGGKLVEVESIATGVDYRALFVRRDDYAAAGLTYTVQFSPDLSVWTPSAALPTVLADNGTHQIVSVPFPGFLSGKKARFFRVQVTIFP